MLFYEHEVYAMLVTCCVFLIVLKAKGMLLNDEALDIYCQHQTSQYANEQ